MSGGEGLRGGGVEAGLPTRQVRSGALAMLSRSAAAHRDTVVFVGVVVVPLAVFTALGIAFAGRGAHGWDGDVVRFVERHSRESVAARLAAARAGPGRASRRRLWRAAGRSVLALPFRYRGRLVLRPRLGGRALACVAPGDDDEHDPGQDLEHEGQLRVEPPRRTTSA